MELFKISFSTFWLAERIWSQSDPIWMPNLTSLSLAEMGAQGCQIRIKLDQFELLQSLILSYLDLIWQRLEYNCFLIKRKITKDMRYLAGKCTVCLL